MLHFTTKNYRYKIKVLPMFYEIHKNSFDLTDKEKEERVIEELVGDITRKIHDYQQKEYEKESLRERLRKLESN